jgi:cysteine-rich repeat protein
MRWLLLLLVAAGCSGSVCGNGKIEDGEECDDGNTVDGDGCSAQCKFVATVDTYVHFLPFTIEGQPADAAETCGGVEASQVEVTVTGPKTVTQKVQCTLGQVKISSLPAGDYTVTAKAFDGSGNALTRGMAHGSFTQGTSQLQVDVVWPFADFIKDYHGTFYFALSWAGAQTCASAQEPVARERLLLTRDGTPLAGMTDDNVPLDGSQAGKCRDHNTTLAQFVTGLPWGAAKLTVTGEDSKGTALFRGTFDTFIGAGVANGVAELDVPSLLPDAGPDAP